MTYEVEPMQQPVRKAVGRLPTPRQRLRQAEEMGRFVRKFAHESLKRTESDAFPVRKAVGRSARSGVDFAVVGGLAVILNGYPRLTLDADILVQNSPDNLRKLLDYLKTWGDGAARELMIEDFNIDQGAIRISEEFDLDVFVVMRGKSLNDFRPNLRRFASDEVQIAYLSPADLIYLKEGSWREKDQLDVSAMKQIVAKEGSGHDRPD